MGSVRGQTITPSDDMLWHVAQVAWDAALAKREAVAVPDGFVPIPPGIQSVDRDFEYDASTGMHIPKVVVRFTPGKDTDAKTWDGRDKLAWSITQAARSPLAASKGEKP